MYTTGVKIVGKLLLPSILVSSFLSIYNHKYPNKANNIDYKSFYYCYSSV